MGFFQTSDNKNIEAESDFKLGGNAGVIPAGTRLFVLIDEAKWDSYNGETYISLRWSVAEGEYKNRKVFQKLRVEDEDASKRDKALMMLAAIDKNAGGKLLASNERPDDMSLAINLMNKLMMIEVDVWEMNGKEGNWVCAVGSKELAQQKETSTEIKEEDVPW